MPIKQYTKIIQRGRQKIQQAENPHASLLNPNSIREEMFLLTKDTKNIFFVGTHFKSMSRILHLIEICTNKKKDIVYEIDPTFPGNQPDIKTKLLQAQKQRKLLETKYELIDVKSLLKLLDAKLKRNESKRQVKTVVKRKKQLEQAKKFVKQKLTIYKKDHSF